ncbi:MAG: nuclear transport factor 2 family protein [Gemmatimonadota bacterium]
MTARTRITSRSPHSPSTILTVATAMAFAVTGGMSAQSVEETAVEQVLDALHEAASDGDFDRYFGQYAQEFIFLGTDATERWDRAQFMEYARGPFSQGRGWTYTMIERHVYIAPGGQAAWFDERLDNANLGETRGSGALVKEGGVWKVAQYNLTIPIPNELAREFAAKIREHTGG